MSKSTKQVPEMTPINGFAVFRAAYKASEEEEGVGIMEAHLLREVHQVVLALASGSLGTYDPAMQVVVGKVELDDLYRNATSLAISHPHLGLHYFNVLDCWLNPEAVPSDD